MSASTPTIVAIFGIKFVIQKLPFQYEFDSFIYNLTSSEFIFPRVPYSLKNCLDERRIQRVI